MLHGPGFLSMLMLADGLMPAWYRLQHGLTGRPSYMISHMMDLAPVYNQREGVMPIELQTRRTASLAARSGNGMAYFAAYNPYRDHWPDAEPGRALRLVREAVERHGAMGVKVYPPSGYRPMGNDIPPKPSTLFTSAPGEQWEARYAGLGDRPNEALDARLAALLDFCVERDLPVFVHCNTGEFEARAGYGVHAADPVYWARFLASTPERGRLRLCFGHAGGESFWFGGGELDHWGRLVVDLCRMYPRVYCEIGIHDEIRTTRSRAALLRTLIREFNVPVSEAKPYRLQDKLMFGTDWFMPISMTGREYLEGFEHVFLHPAMRPHYRAFFCGNALSYLNAAERKDDPRLAESVRGWLALALRQHGAEAPIPREPSDDAEAGRPGSPARGPVD